MARRKGGALSVPATTGEATELLIEYVRGEHCALETRLGAEIEIDAIKARRDAVLGELSAVQQTRFAALKAWWEAGGKSLAGKRRSAELAGPRSASGLPRQR